MAGPTCQDRPRESMKDSSSPFFSTSSQVAVRASLGDRPGRYPVPSRALELGLDERENREAEAGAKPKAEDPRREAREQCAGEQVSHAGGRRKRGIGVF